MNTQKKLLLPSLKMDQGSYFFCYQSNNLDLKIEQAQSLRSTERALDNNFPRRNFKSFEK